jgi:serine/threonine-protein kinase SRPK3
VREVECRRRQWVETSDALNRGTLKSGGGEKVLCAPKELVEPGSIDLLPSHISLSTVISDFGQSYKADDIPPHLRPATVTHYKPPEMRFENQVDFPSDIWMLACALFEIRAGHTLFNSFLSSDTSVTKEMVSALGKLPEPWWSKFEGRHNWFDDSGEPRPVEEQKRNGIVFACKKTSLREMVESIGQDEEPPEWCAGWRNITEAREPLSSEEAALLTDLLEKMLRYDPSERLTIREVVSHPWFDYEE